MASSVFMAPRTGISSRFVRECPNTCCLCLGIFMSFLPGNPIPSCRFGVRVSGGRWHSTPWQFLISKVAKMRDDFMEATAQVQILTTEVRAALAGIACSTDLAISKLFCRLRGLGRRPGSTSFNVSNCWRVLTVDAQSEVLSAS